MDVANVFSRLREGPVDRWLGHRHLHRTVSALLALTIGYQLVLLTQIVALRAPSEPLPIARAGNAERAAEQLAELARLDGSHLFGEPPQEAPPVVLLPIADAPDTTLRLTLNGVLFTQADHDNQAIIASGDAQHVYRVGHEIVDADGATVYAVFADRVLLNRGDRLEALRWPEEATALASPKPVSAEASLSPPSLGAVVSQNARLKDVVRFYPNVADGKVVGIRVMPGMNAQAFGSVGLQARDVITAINGQPLDDPAEAAQALASLGEFAGATVTVVREGSSTPEVVVLNTQEIMAARSGRE